MFQSLAAVEFTTPTDSFGESSIAYGQIDQLPSVVTIGHTVTGTPPVGSVEIPVRLTTQVATRPMVNPVLTVVLPAGSTVPAWSMTGGDAGLPTPTLTVIDGFAGGVLVRWTFPDGTVWPEDRSASIDYTIRLASPLQGGLTLPGHASSRSQRPVCVDHDDDVPVDADDLDNDGDLEEIPCRRIATATVMAATTTTVTTSSTSVTTTTRPVGAGVPRDVPDTLAFGGTDAGRLGWWGMAAVTLGAGLATWGAQARRRRRPSSGA